MCSLLRYVVVCVLRLQTRVHVRALVISFCGLVLLSAATRGCVRVLLQTHMYSCAYVRVLLICFYGLVLLSAPPVILQVAQ